jgi:hypothetical protein
MTVPSVGSRTEPCSGTENGFDTDVSPEADDLRALHVVAVSVRVIGG